MINSRCFFYFKRCALPFIVVFCLLGQLSIVQAQNSPTDSPPTPVVVATSTPVDKSDPAGSTTGNRADLANAGASLTAEEQEEISKASGPGMGLLADAVGQNRVGINMTWLLLCGFLVMFMQTGFALVETGFTRAKNACHTMLMNFSCYFLGIFGFWVAGFALMYGAAGPIGSLGGLAPIADGAKVTIPHLGSIFATKGFFLSGSTYDVGVCAMFLFQAVFLDTAVTIPTGAMAERWKFSSFIGYCLFISIIIYPIFGHWAWGGGWLSQLGNNFGLGVGYADFAGSGVVHAVGGFTALAGAMALGPRIGKYNKDGTANPIPGHNIPLALTGVMILGFGWFGFNAGSTFGAAGGGNLRIGIVSVTTMMASAGGAIAAMMYMYATTKKPDPSMTANGFLAGLVAITAPCAFVSPSVAVLIGAIGGLLMCWAVAFLEVIHVDDPVGAIAVHAFCGLWGVLCVGIFADGTYGAGWNGTVVDGKAVPLVGILHGGTGQFFAQLIGGTTAALWSFGTAYGFFKFQDMWMRKSGGIRPAAEDEMHGLDIPETGIVAYPPDFDDYEVPDEEQVGGEPAYAPGSVQPVPA